MGTWGGAYTVPFGDQHLTATLFHSGRCLFLTTWDRGISAIQDLPHELHSPRDVACLIGQTETEAWELPFQ